MYYSDPPMTEKEKQALEEKKKNGESYTEPTTMKDITPYVIDVEWNGDIDQAARKLSFKLAYNTAVKDVNFPALILKMGGFIYAYYEDDTQPKVMFFSGRIFFEKRNTSGFTFEYVAYDDLIYLAKSKIQLNFQNVTITDAIKTICSEIGIEVSESIPSLPTVINYLADGKSCTEMFKIFNEKSKADTTNGSIEFTVLCIEDKITAVKKGELIADYTATDGVNIEHTEHSQSIEDMVNRIKAVDDVGNICQVFTINDDVTHYGMIQDIYKMQPAKQGESVDNVKAAKAMLKRLKEDSSLEGIGNIQCITGYGITIQEEQLKGNFFIKSDDHKFQNNVHTMSLTLEYMPETKEEPEIEQQDLAAPVFKSASQGRKKTYNTATGGGDLNISAGMQAGWNAWGYQTMDNGTEGCCEAATKVGSYYSPFLAGECNNGVVSVPTLVGDANAAGVPVIDFDASQLEEGDCIVYYTSEGADGHVTIYDGNGGYIGNSSSQNMVVHSGDYSDCGTPMRIIKTSHY